MGNHLAAPTSIKKKIQQIWLNWLEDSFRQQDHWWHAGEETARNRSAKEFLGLKAFGQQTSWALRNFTSGMQVQVPPGHRVTTSAITPMACATGDVPSMSTKQQLSPWFKFLLSFFTEQFLLLGFFFSKKNQDQFAAERHRRATFH